MSYCFLRVLLIGLFCLHRANGAALAGYGGDPNTISVSGISAGGAMAVQFHVAFSSEIIGAGIVAGLSYHCADGTLVGADQCMYEPYLINVNSLIDYTDRSAAEGLIDDPSNIAGDKVYIFDGTSDTVVFPENGKKTQQYYENYGADILTEFDVPAQHCMPTVDYGNNCLFLMSPYISKCDYDAAYILLNHIYGDLAEPSGSATGQVLEFDQTEFISGDPAAISLDTIGYIYVPTYCSQNTGCRVHLAFHGCEQGRSFVDDTYARNAGYNEVADANNLIIVYPQAARSFTTPSNPNGCFDWWAYTDKQYALKSGVQMEVIHKILERVLS